MRHQAAPRRLRLLAAAEVSAGAGCAGLWAPRGPSSHFRTIDQSLLHRLERLEKIFDLPVENVV